MKLKSLKINCLSCLLFSFFCLIYIDYGYSQIPPLIEALPIKKRLLATSSDLNQIFFLNDKIGWILSEKEIFKTEDGGISWRTVRPKLLKGEKLSQVSFQDSKNGILVVQKKLIDLDDGKNYFKVLMTINGGLHWNERRIENNGIARSIVFSDAETGWIAGYKKQGHSLIGYKYLLLHTRNGGQNWEDFSSKIEMIVIGNKKPVNYKVQNHSILNATLDHNGLIQLFINNGTILTLSNSSDTWSKAQISNPGIGYATFCCSGSTENGDIWYSTTAKSMEGIYGAISIQNNNSEIKRNGIGNIFFENVLYLNSEKFVVVGSYFPKNRKREGIVLYTSNNGVTWRTLYYKKNISTFYSISKLSDQKLVAIGANGNVIEFNISKLKD